MSASAPDYASLLRDALVTIRGLRRELEERRREPVAVVGIGCRFAGDVSSPDEAWTLFERGVDAIAEIPADRWDSGHYHDPDPAAAGKICTRLGGFFTSKDRFDPQFFKISPREATYMDPQQRVLLEVAWEALEHANIPADSLYGSDSGVFIGISAFDYANLIGEYLPEVDVDPTVGTGSGHSVAAGRLSYVFGFRGPSLSVDTACSASLVAVQAACDSLLRRECTVALAGGVNMMLAPFNHIVFSRAHMLAPDGHCKAFDEAADGYVRSEGAGVIVLKRLSDALADGNTVLAVIRGGAVNHAGASGGLTVPNGPAQQECIRRALENAGVAPAAVDYVEAHGTGTALGDPIELAALGEVYGAGRDPERPLLVASAKTNLGHMEAAAGIGGLIKVILQLQRGAIAPHLHLVQPSSRIPWSRLPIRVPTALTPWPARPGRTRLAGVSSFGFAGTNAHLIVEEAPAGQPSSNRRDRPIHLLPLSAKSEPALAALVERYAAHLETAASDAADVAYAAGAGRSHFGHRVAVLGRSTADLARGLDAIRQGQQPPGTCVSHRGDDGSRAVAFVFTGQGSQFAGMGRELYETSSAFREVLDRCDAVVRDEMGWSALDVLYTNGSGADVNQTAYAQPLLFALEYALTSLWRAWGVQPSLVMGHSVGEYVAASVAGVFSLEDGLRLVARRGALMQALPRDGGMAAVHAPLDVVEAAIASHASQVSIAAVNGPRHVVISGPLASLREILAALLGRGVRSQMLKVSHAFHSPLMSPMLDAFAEAARKVAYNLPQLPIVSNLTGRVESDLVTIPEYWVRHVGMPVRFQEGVHALHEAGCLTFLEIGPNPTLARMGRTCIEGKTQWLASLNPDRGDWEQMLESLAALYVKGHHVDWAGVDRGYARRPATLPTYPFQRERYWFAPHVAQTKLEKQNTAPPHPLLGVRVSVPAAEEGAAADRIVFEARIGPDAPAYLGDHRVFDKAILPAAGYLELAAAAGRHALGRLPVVRGVTIRAPLALRAGVVTVVRTSLTPQGAAMAFDIRSRIEEDGEPVSKWELHAQGTVDDRQGPAGPALDLASLRHDLGGPIDPRTHYDRVRQRGLDYGPAFQPITELGADGPRALGRVVLPDALAADAAAYLAHPVLLDGAFQMLAATLPPSHADATYLPTGVESMTVVEPLGAAHWVDARVRADSHADARLLTGDVRLLDADGRVLVEVAGLQLARTREAALHRALEGDPADLMFEPRWRRAPLAAATPAAAEPRRLVVFADRGGVGRAAAQALRDRGVHTALVVAGDGRDEACRWDDGTFSIDPARPDQVASVLAEPHEGVLYFWGLDVPDAREDAAIPLDATGNLGCDPLLALVKACGAGSPPIWLVTRGAFAADERTAVRFELAALSGFVRAVRAERPTLRVVQVDLDPNADPRQAEVEIRQIVAEVVGGDAEDEVAFRRGLRRAARLVAVEKAAGAARPVRVSVTKPGVIENVAVERVERRAPGPGEVEIAVRAAGLNFKDVLYVLGMLEQPARAADGASPGGLTLGFECSGVVAAVGEGVGGRKVGDAVIGYGGDCLRSHVVLSADAVVDKPDAITYEEAAGTPTAFLTAYHALYTLARVRPGDTVLVHAAAGGVGQAAIQLCRRAGATVYATASAGKWDFLRAQGIELVMSSRDVAFKDRILEATGGRGVDVVLNSLNGDFIPANLDALARGGRFVEIGKIGIWTGDQVAAARPDVSYFTFDLSDQEHSAAASFRPLLIEVTRWLSERAIEPLTTDVFPLADVAAALRHLAHAKSVGKVVVTFPSAPAADDSPLVRDDRTYLVTGGAGALGLTVAEWLVRQGARHLVIASRGGRSEAALAARAALERQGARVESLAVDVADRACLAAELRRLEPVVPPIAGIVHAAGVLDDGVLDEQTPERLTRVLSPKVNGAWNLHALTQDQPLDWFVCFGSVSGVLGSAGQSNYAAANACMDALMHHRRSLGLPGASIDWGPWASVGMAARLDARRRRQLRAKGVRPIDPGLGVSALAAVVRRRSAQVMVAAIDWAAFVRHARAVPRLLEALVSKEAGRAPRAARASQVERLKKAAPSERREIMASHLAQLLGATLGFPSDKRIDRRDTFFDLGMDSLSAVEFAHHIEASLGRSLPTTALFDHPTLQQLADHLLETMAAAEVDPAPSRSEAGPAQTFDSQPVDYVAAP